MPTLLKILFTGLLLLLVAALGAEVVALHRVPATPAPVGPPVLVRKSPKQRPPAKTVRQLALPAPGSARY